MREKNLGKIVAAMTVRTEIRGRDDVPIGSRSLVSTTPEVTSVEAMEIEIPSVARVIDDEAPCFSTTNSEIVFSSGSV
jgi:hypothetical protein